MDACEIANFLATELFMQQLVSLDGMQSGVPTLTTSTLTPTTLRNIEQTFIELASDPPVSVPYQAGFVPPLAPFNFTDCNDNNSMASTESGSQSSWHTPILHEENSLATDTSSVATLINPNGSPSLPVATSTALVANNQQNQSSATGAKNSGTPTPSRRNLGGRRPTKPSNLTPEEEEKRRQRRERNKLAAARCRKRRVDQTNELIDKVNQLEKDKEGLQKQIEELTALKEDIQLCLEAHRSHCTLNSMNDIIGAESIDRKPTLLIDEFDTKCIKTEPVDSLDGGPPLPKRIMLSSNNAVIPPSLPNVSTISTTIASCLLSTPSVENAPTSITGVDVCVSSSADTSIQSTVDVNNATLTNSTASSSVISNPISLIPLTTKPNRPSTLNVPLTMTPSQSLLNKGNNNNNNIGASDITGVPITTPSSGVMFNFDSLMDGGTGLTPVTAPLMPTCSSQNKHPLEFATPTSEPSKLVSL